MKISDLSMAEQSAIPRILKYWVARWDWECPTLFGLEQSEFQEIVNSWPACLSINQKAAALAVIGGMREFLYGASTAKPEAIPSIAGISYKEVEVLINRLLPEINKVLG